jgi:hypothetical protein
MQNVCSNEKKVLKILCGRNVTTWCSESLQVTYKLVNSRSIGKFSIKKRIKTGRNNGEKGIQEREEKKTQILKYKQQICSVTFLLEFGYIARV